MNNVTALPHCVALCILLAACGKPPAGSDEPAESESPPQQSQFTLEIRDSRDFGNDEVVAKLFRPKIVESPDRSEELASGSLAAGRFTVSLPFATARGPSRVLGVLVRPMHCRATAYEGSLRALPGWRDRRHRPAQGGA